MKDDVINRIIVKYFNNICTDDEIQSLKNWLRLSKVNQQHFLRLRKIWVLSSRELENRITDSKELIKKNLLAQIRKNPTEKYSKKSVFSYSLVSAILASVLVFISIGLVTNMFSNHEEDLYTEIYMPSGEKGRILLSDGTEVWLNADSKLSFGNKFNTDNRFIKLEGEAFFDVKLKKAKNDLIVRVKNTDVVVHGTSFNVNAYSESDEVVVSLKRGSVKVFESDTKNLLTELFPNEQVSINANTLDITKSLIINDCDFVWTHEELIFEKASIHDVFSKMERWYGVQINVSYRTEELEGLRYRFKIKSESLTEMLELIDKMTPINYLINGKEVTVTYK